MNVHTELRAAHRAALRALRPGDTVTTGIRDPWGGPTTDCRFEHVTKVGRLTVRTHHALYTINGLCLRPQPLAYPRRIIRTHRGRTQ